MDSSFHRCWHIFSHSTQIFLLLKSITRLLLLRFEHFSHSMKTIEIIIPLSQSSHTRTRIWQSVIGKKFIHSTMYRYKLWCSPLSQSLSWSSLDECLIPHKKKTTTTSLWPTAAKSFSFWDGKAPPPRQKEAICELRIPFDWFIFICIFSGMLCVREAWWMFSLIFIVPVFMLLAHMRNSLRFTLAALLMKSFA